MKLKRLFVFFALSLALFMPAISQNNEKYAKIPFVIRDNLIMISLDIFGNGSLYDVLFDTSGSVAWINENGKKKMERYFGHNMREILLDAYQDWKSSMTDEKINTYIDAMLDGRFRIFNFRSIKCEEGVMNNLELYLSPDTIPSYSDGFVGLTAFEGAKNLLINFKEKVIEVNAPLKKKKGMPLHKVDLGIAYAYYIMGQIDGVEQPIILNLGNLVNTVREDSETARVYEGDDLMEILSSTAPIPSESGTTHVAKLKLRGVSGKIDVVKYDDTSLLNSNFMRRVSSVFNTLGYGLFKDKCVQFDFENMMLYVW